MGVFIINIGTKRSAKQRTATSSVVAARVTREEVRAAVIAAGVGELVHVETLPQASTEDTHIVVLRVPEDSGFHSGLLRVSRALEQDCVAWMHWPYGPKGAAHAGLTGDDADAWLPFNPQYFRLPALFDPFEPAKVTK